ncbi:CHAT domain-containing protein [Aquimarina addita]|uniref:CHAT domain-containing protein n=1 Tax=Aquimarina addita TaxID=870485 RepID=A0ABP7X9M3_9FLAO
MTFILNSNKELAIIEGLADSLLTTYKRPEQDALLASEMHEYGKWIYEKNIKKALSVTKKASEIRKHLIPYDANSHSKSLNNLIFFSRLSNDYINAIKYGTEYIEVTPNFDKKTEAYWRLGIDYWKINDYANALLLYRKVAQIYQQQNRPIKLATTYIQSAIVHESIKDEKNINLGITKGLKADSILSNLNNPPKKLLFKTYSVLANLYNATGKDSINSLKYFNEILQLGKKEGEDEWVGKTFIDIEILKKNKGIDTSLFYQNQALKYLKNNNTWKAIIYQNRSWTYYDHDNTEMAIENSKVALQCIIPHKPNISTSNLPNHTDLTVTKNKLILLEILKDNVKFGHQLFEENKNKTELENSLKISRLGDELLDIIRLETVERQSKLFWKNDASDLYTDAVKTCILLNQPEKAFYFQEKNKALLLLEDINEEQLKRVNHIPDAITKRELSLKQKIANIQNKLNITNTPSVNDSLKLKLLSTKQKHSLFVDSLKSYYPQYYNSKRTSKITSIEDTKQYADQNNTTFIEYILDNEQGYGLVISKDIVKLFEIKNIHQLQKDIKVFSELISHPIHFKNELHQYQEIGKRIYNQLIPKDIRSFLTEKITIIPDQSIHNIPFEALPNNSKEYLIYEYEINYAYSISFLIQNSKLVRTAEKEFLGFAPITYKNNLKALPNTKLEVEKIASNFNGSVLLNENASKQNLITYLSKYNIIHLSTHANANDSITPWIAAIDDKITLNDIYATQNNADLVVLSACNTSIGSIEKGEGVMSLARGFFNTGANSVVSTLWKADDTATLEITTDFYKQLKANKSKSEALRTAKLNYLKNHKMEKNSPYYWSLLILIGDTESLSFTSRTISYPFLLISLVVLIGIISILIFKKHKRRIVK